MGVVQLRNIVVVEAISTGFNYIRDIVNRNFYPIVLNTKIDCTEENEAYQSMVNDSNAKIDVDHKLLNEKDTYEETLEMVREYDPLLVIPGSERGVILATRLSNDLNLKCNPIENLDAMTLKDKMHERLAEKGLRHIRGCTVKSVEEAIEYYDNEGFEKVVIKPVYSAGSVGVRICSNREELIDSLNQTFGTANVYGDGIAEILIQEFIDGEEYIVNTVSCEGNHRVTTIWKYNKLKTSEGGSVYDSMATVNELGIGESGIVEYAYKVLDAIDIRYGAVHAEYMIDERGPVLIEVNCRPAGADLDARFVDIISGQHETDSSLDSYLDPENFYYHRDMGYRLYAYGALKFFIVPKDMLAESSPTKFVSGKLKSHYRTSQEIIEEPRLFVKTQNLETTGGTVFLVSKDEYVLQKDLNFLRSVEKYAFELVLSEDLNVISNSCDNVSLDEIRLNMERIKTCGSTLFVTDQFIDGFDSIMQVSPEEIDDVGGEFKIVVVNLNKSFADKNEAMIVSLLLKILDMVKIGGLIFIPQSTYNFIPNGRICIEALIKVMDFKLELPIHGLEGFMVASKR